MRCGRRRPCPLRVESLTVVIKLFSCMISSRESASFCDQALTAGPANLARAVLAFLELCASLVLLFSKSAPVAVVTMDDLDVEMHFPKEGVVLSRESRSSEKFMHGIKVLMAKNYIDNLSEEARKGMQEKAEQGIGPTVAPLGYRNVVGADGKKIIEPDPESAPIISRLFEWD